ncbi:hypothetical protein JCGZ_12750 [Jatropha curcas]|uniref:Aminotransferase-like plant mobile domain-containing protein n=1 Tax=Jatropha curcas TaxID=180498 RepID=A0A067KE35_JATCU|nr:hypothetical protein JCGZ_12750 [Jatropha curcas]
MVFRFKDSEVTPTYEEICAVMDHHPEQNETPALPPGPRYNIAQIMALCPVYFPDGIDADQGLPLEPFLNKVLSMNVDPSWIRACCFLLLNVYALQNLQPEIGDFRLLTIVRDMQLYRRTVFMMIMGETMCWALDKLSLLLPVPARLIPTYGPANFRSRTRGHFDFGDNPTIRISRQYGMIQRVPRIYNFKSGLITSHLLISLADRWRNRNTVYLDEGTMQDAVTPAYVNWFFTPQ